MAGPARELRFEASKSSGVVSGLLILPADARVMLVLGHGAGAGMRHPFMESVSGLLADRGVATFRYQFPYMEKGGRRPDPQPVLLATLRSAVEAAAGEAPGLPMLAGGKSMGGRMTSLAAAAAPLSPVEGLVFLGFPLHAAGRPSTERAAHLPDVGRPMLFLQGTRDRLADLDLLRPICARLPRCTLHVIDDADHSFRVLKRTGRTLDDVLAELADTTLRWSAEVLTRS